jgi:hypothetical protein
LICSYEKKREGDRLKCNVCGENFRERHHLTRHMTAHQDRKEEMGVADVDVDVGVDVGVDSDQEVHNRLLC